MKLMHCRTLSVASLLTALLAIGPRAWAGPHGAMGGPFGRDLFSIERLASELDLSDAQRTAAEKLLDEARLQARPYVRRLMEQRKAMRELSEAAAFDEAAVRALAAQGAAITTDLTVLRARTRHALRDVLTPAQREKVSELHRHRGKHW